ncbi:MAG: hypothetical protein K0S33_3489 [Bacteroidetes bacterium]|nr:hypothetical protein [Bacteroidota bacterium]
MHQAKVAQLVELQPSKLEVAGSRPVFRSEDQEQDCCNNPVFEEDFETRSWK